MLYSIGTEELWEQARPPKERADRRSSRPADGPLPGEVLARLLLPPLDQDRGGGLLLTIELVPRNSWGDNLRRVVGRQTWDQIRRAAYRASGYRCAICGATGQLSCHERWAYDDERGQQTLLGFLALCRMCHWVQHIGLASVLARAGQLDDHAVVRHFLAVNACDEATFQEHHTASAHAGRLTTEGPRTCVQCGASWRLSCSVVPVAASSGYGGGR